MEAAPPRGCDPQVLVELAARGGEAAGEWAKEDRVICQWLPYVAGLVGCAATATPLFYTACAVVVACNFCHGGWVTSVCGSF